jgi:hypothetical protein
MKVLGFLILVAGWAIVLAAVALLPAAPARSLFVTAGIGVEVLGLALAVGAHRSPQGGGE